MNFNYIKNNITTDISLIFQPASATSSYNNTMTGYKKNNTELLFLKPFTTDTDANSSTSTYQAIINEYKSSGSSISFCPKYILHGGTAYYTNQTTYDSFTATSTKRADTTLSATTIPTGVTGMGVVVIGAGGGGGGGGAESANDSGGQADAGGGAGGGGGAMKYQYFNIVSGNTTYSGTIGSGGIYGQPNNRTTNLLKPGKEDTNGNLKDGRSGGAGGDTSFTYNGTTLTASGGGGGGGGRSNTDSGGGESYATGGSGGTATTSTTDYSGENGETVSNASLPNGTTIPGGTGGRCGNLNTSTNVGRFVNTNYISFVSPQWRNTGADTNNITDLDNVTNPNGITETNLKYGEGGHGGMGDDNGSHYGFAGEVGAPGCIIIFFYYT